MAPRSPSMTLLPEQTTKCCEGERPRGASFYAANAPATSDIGRSLIGPGLQPVNGFDLDLPSATQSAMSHRHRRPDRHGSTHSQEPTSASRRRLLWEIRDGYHCSICGTCLSFAELRKIAAKAGIGFEPDENEYGIHGTFVQLAAKPGRVAKLVQKVLDRKYRSALGRFHRAKTEAEVDALWSQALTEGNVPGPYWALMTHPRATAALMVQAFGEVHMLSHLAGATNRADIRRLRVLEGERQELSEQLTEARRRLSDREAEHRHLCRAHEAEVRGLTRRLRAAQATEAHLAQMQERLRACEGGEALLTLRNRSLALKSELEQTQRELRSESQRRVSLENELSALRAAHQETSATVRALNAECDALESVLRSGIDAENHAATETDAAVDLCGRRIAYVGGRTGIVEHFRALVERLNGRFIHHDGGIEDHEGQLGRILGQADVVLCPMDCVSHRASIRAKRFCKQTAKPFVPLRSAGLSSFVTGLRRAVGVGCGFATE